MGSPLRLTVALAAARSPAGADPSAAWDAVREEFEGSEQAMSRFRATSEITVINRLADRDPPAAVSRRLWRALVACERAHRLTEGRFDPRVLRDLERLGDRGAPIDAIEPDPTRDWTAGQRMMEWATDRRIRLPRPVDLGGIGKGLALRWAAGIVERFGLRNFLLEAGGDLVTRGEPPDGEPWRVGLEDPMGGAEPLAVLAVRDAALATSSIRRRSWIAGGRLVHHLIDPLTGEPGDTGLLAVTVAGPDPAWSEVWSKTLFLEGRAGIATLARRRGLAAWWVTADGALEMTAAGRLRTVWTGSVSDG